MHVFIHSKNVDIGISPGIECSFVAVFEQHQPIDWLHFQCAVGRDSLHSDPFTKKYVY